MPQRLQAARTLLIAYLSAFFVIFFLATCAQAVIQLSLHRESISRQASTILASNILAEQRLQQDDVLLITKDSHVATVKDMGVQVRILEQNHVAFINTYLSTYPAIPQLKHAQPQPYDRVVTDTQKIITFETQVPPLTEKQRILYEFPFVTRLFYDSDAHLVLVVAAEKIVDSDTDAYITRIQVIEITLYSLTLLTLLFEALCVIRPTLKRTTQSLSSTPTPTT